MLEGKSLNLRLMEESDLDEYLDLDNRYAEQGEFLPPRFRSRTSIRKDFQDTNGYWGDDKGCLVITTKEGRMVGCISFIRRIPAQAGIEIGYQILKKEDRGRGYGTEALRMIVAFLFESKPIPRLEIVTTADNSAARRIAEKCGFRHEGTMRSSFYVRGRYVDSVVYGLLREESN